MVAVPIAPAATIALLQRASGALQVLLVKRSDQLVFGPGHWVFPGGRIDAADYALAGSEDPWAAGRQAAIREAAEETGLRIDPAGLQPVSVWTTPPGYPRRFKAYFFASELDCPAPVTVDGGEIVDHRWLPPARALEQWAQGAMPLLPPTLHTLQELAEHAEPSDFLARCAERRPQHRVG